MKVLSIKQPWAKLIVEGYKCYEFRSWNTKFRGEFLIHASKTVDEKAMKRFSALNLDYKTGCIIGSATLTDCINVNETFENKLIEENELVYGASRGRSGYAFKLENVKKFDDPIYVNGSLGFWDYYNEFEIMDMMEKIEYGYVDKNKVKHLDNYDTFSEDYILQSPKQVIKSRVGVCWDQVELERYYFKNSGLKAKTYFIVHYGVAQWSTHTFLTFEKNGKYYWFERPFEKYKGIHEYRTLKDLLLDVREKFIKDIKEYDPCNLYLYNYEKPKYGISEDDFYEHCGNSVNINIDNLI